ncbi:MAG: hypothetical protein HQL87_13145 [Magnetococcales bacterium]|nr:hypothetical protein [Magnetococcales bacterium]
MANASSIDSPPSAPVKSSPASADISPKKARFLGQLLLILSMATLVMLGVNGYRDAIQKKRAGIMHLIEKKGFDMEDPTVKALYVEASMTYWLPALDNLLNSLQHLPKKGIEVVETLPGNPEKGSYIEYIQRHDLSFDEKDALEWQTRSLRKPVDP